MTSQPRPVTAYSRAELYVNGLSVRPFVRLYCTYRSVSLATPFIIALCRRRTLSLLSRTGTVIGRRHFVKLRYVTIRVRAEEQHQAVYRVLSTSSNNRQVRTDFPHFLVVAVPMGYSAVSVRCVPIAVTYVGRSWTLLFHSAVQ